MSKKKFDKTTMHWYVPWGPEPKTVHKQAQQLYDDQGNKAGVLINGRDQVRTSTQDKDWQDQVMAYTRDGRKRMTPRPRKRRKGIPSWAQDLDQLRRRILFPALRTLDIAIRYWRQGEPAWSIAANKCMSEDAVKSVLRQLRKSDKRRAEYAARLPRKLKTVQKKAKAKRKKKNILPL